MAKAVDVYRDWLGIQDPARPLGHYQLLRLPKFEDNVATIRSHFKKMAAHVRKYAASDYTGRAQALLRELTAAMLCLTDAQRKRDYDARLGRTDAGGLSPRGFEDILLADKVIDQTQLAKARNYAQAVGLEIRDAVLQQKLATPDVVMTAFAESVGLPYVALGDLDVSPELMQLIPSSVARQHSCVPIMADPAQVLIASPNPLAPEVEEVLRKQLGKQVRTVLCTAAAVNEVVTKHYPPDGTAAAPGSPHKAAQAAKPKAPPQPMTLWERQKQRIMVTVIAFNITVMLSVFVLFFVRGGFYRIRIWPDLIIAAVLGVASAMVTHSLAPRWIR